MCHGSSDASTVGALDIQQFFHSNHKHLSACPGAKRCCKCHGRHRGSSADDNPACPHGADILRMRKSAVDLKLIWKIGP